MFEIFREKARQRRQEAFEAGRASAQSEVRPQPTAENPQPKARPISILEFPLGKPRTEAQAFADRIAANLAVPVTPELLADLAVRYRYWCNDMTNPLSHDRPAIGGYVTHLDDTGATRTTRVGVGLTGMVNARDYTNKEIVTPDYSDLPAHLLARIREADNLAEQFVRELGPS